MRADWTRDLPLLQSIRRTVFVLEQHVPEELEWDAFDAVSEHVIAVDGRHTAAGTGRLLPDGHIGRMAVLREWRRRGAGSAILAELISIARDRGVTEVRLHAQTHAIGFYERQGFVTCGGEFLEAGIPHRAMVLGLKPGSGNAFRRESAA